VHTSNYRIVGFTESVSIDELIGLAGDCDIPIIEDLGSGVLIDLEKYGLSHEPTVQESISKGADVVCFSGDKLLGGPQAGIIIGRKKYIDRMKKNQLTRALRIDKFTATALELVLKEYQSKEEAVKNIPVLRMITKPLEEVKVGAEKLAELISKSGLSAQVELCPCESQIGGGSLPLERIKSMAVSIRPSKMSVTEMEERMRKLTVPIIPRIADDAILLDVRTIKEDRFELIAKELGELAS
jgi:L-seryl-tRNA(Ser) seleniumtransferase